MDTVALRYADNIAPVEGTIVAHQRMIDEKGFVWYEKFGLPLSLKVKGMILSNDNPRILLIQSGKALRFWAYVDAISYEEPSRDSYPSYYHDKADRVKTWFRVVKFEEAEHSIMSKCFVKSSGASLSSASRHSMSPYFIIETKGDDND